MRDADLIERLPSTSASSASSSSDEGAETVINKPLVKRKHSEANSLQPAKEEEIEYLYGQNFYHLRNECLKEDQLFEDPEFPADNDLLRLRSERYIDDVEWMRPGDIARPEDPVLVSDRNEGFDIRTSLDGWFVPAFSAVAESEALLKQVIPFDQGFNEAQKYAGIFRFRFWFGRWIEIVVDDRLPVRKGICIYMRSTSEVEFWPALLEKAYAKAKGSYELLNRWLPIDGCIELTGGVPEKVRNLPGLLAAEDNGKAADRLFFDLVRASQLGNLILAQAPRKVHKGDKHNHLRLAEASQLGLEVKYVYLVTQVANLGEGRQIIRVKNCSGPKPINWIGAWHPEDTRWANVGDSIRRELDAETFHDGGFWMAYGDFLKYFQDLDICHISHDIDQDITFHGRWEEGLNAGGVQKGDWKNFAKNPQCFIRLSDPDPIDPQGRSSAIVSLMQRRQPSSRAKGMNKIGFRVYRVDETSEELSAPFFSYRRNDGSHKPVAKTSTWQDGRETNVRLRLSQGKYAIIPCTFEPRSEGDFILRIHVERYSNEVDENEHTSAGAPLAIEDKINSEIILPRPRSRNNTLTKKSMPTT